MSDWEQRMSQRMSERKAAQNASVWAQAEAMNAVYNDSPEPSLAEVVVNVPPRLDDRRCAHGLVLRDNSDIAGMAFAAGWMFCQCCLRDRPYIDSAMHVGVIGGGQTSSVSSSTDKHLCRECGGRTRRVVEGMPSGSSSTTGCSCDREWSSRRTVDATKESSDPRISYTDVKACADCGKVVTWTTVWFAELRP